MKDFELKDLEQTLLMEEKSFGIISKDTYTPFEPGDSDWIEYTLAIVNLYPRSIFPTIGGDLTVRRNSKGNVFDTSICMSNGSHKILRLTIEDVLKIMDIFQKNNRELIFDFRQDYRSFDMEKYINRIARLTE
jgi:hypothetical protein